MLNVNTEAVSVNDQAEFVEVEVVIVDAATQAAFEAAEAFYRIVLEAAQLLRMEFDASGMLKAVDGMDGIDLRYVRTRMLPFFELEHAIAELNRAKRLTGEACGSDPADVAQWEVNVAVRAGLRGRDVEHARTAYAPLLRELFAVGASEHFAAGVLRRAILADLGAHAVETMYRLSADAVLPRNKAKAAAWDKLSHTADSLETLFNNLVSDDRNPEPLDDYQGSIAPVFRDVGATSPDEETLWKGAEETRTARIKETLRLAPSPKGAGTDIHTELPCKRAAPNE